MIRIPKHTPFFFLYFFILIIPFTFLFIPSVCATTSSFPSPGTTLQYNTTRITHPNLMESRVTYGDLRIQVESSDGTHATYLLTSESEERYEFHQVALISRLTDEGRHYPYFVDGGQGAQLIDYGGRDQLAYFAGVRSVGVLGTFVDCWCYAYSTVTLDSLETVQVLFCYDVKSLVLVKVREIRTRGSFLTSQTVVELTDTNVTLQYNGNPLLALLTNSWETLVSWVIAISIACVIIYVLIRRVRRRWQEIRGREKTIHVM